jgi:hypothetical protein
VREDALQRNNTENSKYIFTEKELRGHSPNFHIHVPVSDLYIPTIDLPILLLQLFISPKGGPTFLGFFLYGYYIQSVTFFLYV